MIQDIYPYVLNNQYDCSAVPEEKDLVFVFRGGELLVKKNSEELQVPTVGELRGLWDTISDGKEPEMTEMLLSMEKEVFSLEQESLTYLFHIDSERYFMLNPNVSLPEEQFPDYEYREVRSIRKMGMQPKHRIFAALTGKHLMDWYRDTQFCGRCGQKMTHSLKERAQVCSCGYTAYPRIMPAVIVGVINGEQLLLTKYNRGYQNYALVAGFTEIGETLEETVAREVMEETGLKVKNIRYYKSQPWGIANDILMGYYCEVDGSTEIHRDEQELKVAEWVQREEIELQPDDYSLTNEMMWRFKEGLEHGTGA